MTRRAAGRWLILLTITTVWLVPGRAEAQVCVQASVPPSASPGQFVNPVTPFFANSYHDVDTVTLYVCDEARDHPQVTEQRVKDGAQKWVALCKQQANIPKFPNFAVDWAGTRAPVADQNSPAYRRSLLITIRDEAPQIDKVTGEFHPATWNATTGVIELYTLCPGRTSVPCTLGGKIKWDSTWGASVIAHEIGHALGLEDDVSSCGLDTVMRPLTEVGDMWDVDPSFWHCQLAVKLMDADDKCHHATLPENGRHPCEIDFYEGLPKQPEARLPDINLDVEADLAVCDGIFGWSCTVPGQTLSNCSLTTITVTDMTGSETTTEWVCDPTGSLEGEAATTSPIEGIGPLVRLDSPTEGAALEGDVALSGWAVDYGTVAATDFFVDGQPVTLKNFTQNRYAPGACNSALNAAKTRCDPNAGFRGTLDTRIFSRGWHQLQMRVTDGLGWQTYVNRDVFMEGCETTPPTVSLTSPTGGSTVNGTIQVAASASDNDKIKRVAFFVDGVRVANDFTAPYAFSWNTETVSNGSHTLMARAFDACGNWQGTKSTVTVSNFVPCQANSTTLCFQNDRFSARLSINGHSGLTIPFTNTGGFFRLADPENVEVAVKVLDGRASNGRFWVFHGSLTTQPYTVTVTDTHTGRVRSYSNDGLCGGADVSSFVDSAWWYDLAVSSGTCEPTTRSVCLQGDRFRVEVLQSGDPQRGVAVTRKTGSFGFASTSDPEVVVKMLDGRAVNNRYWVFFGSLTNQSYAVRVTDTVTGLVKLYSAPGAFCGNADTSAF